MPRNFALGRNFPYAAFGNAPVCGVDSLFRDCRSSVVAAIVLWTLIITPTMVALGGS